MPLPYLVTATKASEPETRPTARMFLGTDVPPPPQAPNATAVIRSAAVAARRSLTASVCRVGEGLREGGVHEQAVDDVAHLQAGGDGEREHRDEFGRVAAHDRPAQDDAGGRVGEDLHEPSRVAVVEGLGPRPEGPLGDGDLAS